MVVGRAVAPPAVVTPITTAAVGGRAVVPAGAPVGIADVADELRRGRYAEAVLLASTVAAFEPLHADAHYLHGVALVNLGRDREASVHLRKAVYLDPGAGFAHFHLACALSRLGEPVAAGRSYRAAAETLGGRPGDAMADELGGRPLAELVALCQSLAALTDQDTATAREARP